MPKKARKARRLSKEDRELRSLLRRLKPKARPNRADRLWEEYTKTQGTHQGFYYALTSMAARMMGRLSAKGALTERDYGFLDFFEEVLKEARRTSELRTTGAAEGANQD